mmetsp:Transcript_9637/g.12583  ORF Transcript_9637/g.12583 Transcript_9637/m.12583 type:complete len:713 (-) Transcript_9637:228-2366(-)
MKRNAPSQPNGKETEVIGLKRNRSQVDAKAIQKNISKRCVDTIRVLAADMVEKACSGHPGAPMGCAPMGHVLWKRVMNYSPTNPNWLNRDRFILSNGHGCALQYIMLHLTGYDLSMDDLKNFRQLGTRTPGHPENWVTPGVEVATGPLGQGISNAVGMALAEQHLGAIFNKPMMPVIDHFTYVICGDGCLQEGVSSESASMAGHFGLGKIIVMWDDNSITIDGDTELAFSEDVLKRYEAYGWHTQHVADGTNLDSIEQALLAAQQDDRPSIIKVTTVIGHGSEQEGTSSVHGAPLGGSDLKFVKKRFGFDPEEHFVVEDEVREHYKIMSKVGKKKEEEWNQMFQRYKKEYPELASEFERRMAGRLPEGLKEKLFSLNADTGKMIPTRKHSGIALNAVAEMYPELMGGSADLTPSNQTWLNCSDNFSKEFPQGRYIRFGIREHAMASVANGMFAYGGCRPYCATFLQFIGYALGGVRVSSLSRFGVLYVMTHDSIGLGEDGPTHQPIELIEQLRAQPNMLVIRPADGRETYGAYAVALERTATPSTLCFTRQNVPEVEGTQAEKVALGAYVLRESEGEGPLDLVLIGTGSEVHLCTQVAERLAAEGGKRVRVVSMPSMELFEEQPEAYRLEVLPEGVPTMSVEASTVGPWAKYAHASWGVQRFGVSAPSKTCFEFFGFNVDNLTQQATAVLDHYKGKDSVPSLHNRPRLSLIA